MTESVIAPATAKPKELPSFRIPPSPPRLPKIVQGLGYAFFRRQFVSRMTAAYGEAFTIKVPLFGNMVVVTDPTLAKQVFTASPEDLGNIKPSLARVFGPGSVFALEGADHRRRRKLLTPPFHGKAMKKYESIVEEETLAEIASWPEGRPFETLEPMMRITLNIILRAIFGADGAQLETLRRIIPPWVTLGSRLAVLPSPTRDLGRRSPWGRLAAYRHEYDTAIDELIDQALADPNLGERTDILSLLLRSTYEDGTPMSRGEIRDELLTLLAAGLRRPPRRWRGRSSGSPGIPPCSTDWSPKPAPTTTSTARPPSWKCSATAPSSTSPAAMSTRPACNSANGLSRKAIRLP